MSAPNHRSVNFYFTDVSEPSHIIVNRSFLFSHESEPSLVIKRKAISVFLLLFYPKYSFLSSIFKLT
nr:MAG TPA: hypothetical protein [Caudoviricetes sp.]